MSITSRGHILLIVNEIADPLGSSMSKSAGLGVFATVSLCNSKGIVVTTYSTSVFAAPKTSSSIFVGEHFLFDNVLYEGTTVLVTLSNVGADSKGAEVIGSASIPTSRLEENVSIQQWYSLPPSSRAAIKLELLYEKERNVARLRTYSRDRDRNLSISIDNTHAVKEELRHRLSAAPSSPRVRIDSDSPSSSPSEAAASSSPYRVATVSAAWNEQDQLAKDQRMIMETLEQLELLSGGDTASGGRASLMPQAKSPARDPLHVTPNMAPAHTLQTPPTEAEKIPAGNLPTGVIDYALIFGPMSLSRTSPRGHSAGTSPVKGGVSPLSPMSLSSTTSSLRALSESNVRIWDCYPAQDLEHSALPGKIEWFACPEGSKWVESEERPSESISSFVLTAGGTADELFGVCLNFYVATLDLFDSCTPSPCDCEDTRCVVEQRPWYESAASLDAADKSSLAELSSQSKQWVCIRLCVLSRYSYFEQIGRCLFWLYRCQVLPLLVPWEYSLRLGTAGDCLPLKLEQALSALCAECPLPIPGMYSVSMRLQHASRGNQTELIHLMLSSPKDLPMCPYSISALVSALGARGTVSVLCCALSECKMLFHSTDTSKLPSICEAIRTLLYPLKWAHVYLPIVPAPLLDLVEAPVPFILGTHTAWLKYIPADCLRDTVLIDCDSGAIACGLADVLQFPDPEDRWLVSGLKMIQSPAERREGCLDSNSDGDNWDDTEKSARIQALVLDVLLSFLKSVPGCLFYLHVSSPIFNRNLLLGTPLADRRKFLEVLTDTNSFHTFTEELSSATSLEFFRQALTRVSVFDEAVQGVCERSVSGTIPTSSSTDGLTELPADTCSSPIPNNIMLISPVVKPDGSSGSELKTPSSPPRRSNGPCKGPPTSQSPKRRGAEPTPGPRLEFVLPDWIALGRGNPGKAAIPGYRALLAERLALYIPWVSWLHTIKQHRESLESDQSPTAIQTCADNMMPSLGPIVVFNKIVSAAPREALPGRSSRLPHALPSTLNNGSDGTSLTLEGVKPPNSCTIVLTDSISHHGSIAGASKSCCLESNDNIQLQGMSKEEFTAYYADSVKTLLEENAGRQQLASSKNAVFGFLVEEKNVNSSLQSVHRFLQLAITGRGSREEVEESLRSCNESMQVLENRQSLISLLKSAKNHSHISSNPAGTLKNSSSSSSTMHVFPLNVSMFEALSCCFQAFLHICVQQEDFLSAYHLLEVGGLYYMAADLSSGDEDAFLSTHVLQHPIYQSSILWRSVLNNRVSSVTASASNSKSVPQQSIVVSETLNYLKIMSALGINFFRALDFIQAIQSDYNLKIEEYFELARFTKRLWAEEEQLEETLSLEEYHTARSSSRSESTSESAMRGHVLGDIEQQQFDGRSRAVTVDLFAGRERAQTHADPMSSNNTFNTTQDKIESKYVQLSLDSAFAAECGTSVDCLGGDVFAVGCESGHVLISSFSRKECQRVKHGPDKIVKIVSLHANSASVSSFDGKTAFASVCSNNIIKLWTRPDSTKQPTCLTTLKNHTQAITCLTARHYQDNRYLIASGDAEGGIRVSLCDTRGSQWTQHPHTVLPNQGYRGLKSISTVTTSGGGFVKDDIVAVGNQCGVIELLDVRETVRAMYRVQAHFSRINSIQFLRPQEFVSSSADRGLSLWDMRVRSPVAFMHDDAGGGTSGRDESFLCETTFGPNSSQKAAHGPITSLAVGGQDNALIISASADNLIKIWDYRFVASKPSVVLKGHKNRVTSIAWDPSGRLQSCSLDGTIRTWETISGANTDITWLWAPGAEMATTAFDMMGELAPGGTPSLTHGGIVSRTFSGKGNVKCFVRSLLN